MTWCTHKAPQNRGFSFIEIWFVGIQAPIFLAILEYGILLGIKKFWPDKELVFKNVDLSMLILSTIYLLGFNVFYWLAWNQIRLKCLKTHSSILSYSFYWMSWGLNKNQINTNLEPIFQYVWSKSSIFLDKASTLIKHI